MTPNAMFIGWNRPIAGREGQAGELFQQLLGYLGKQQSAGLVESFEPVLIGLHGGDMNGFVLVRGSTDNLSKIRHSEEFIGMIMQCGIAIENFGAVDAYQGEALQQLMGKWMELVAKA